MDTVAVLETFTTAASVLAALVALLAFALGVTRTARLRRREQLFREALATLEAHRGDVDESVRVAAQMHRATLGELIARQLVSPWRVVWPWLVWLLVVVVSGQSGYLLAKYVASDAGWDYDKVMLAVYGDTLSPILGIGVVLTILPVVYESYIHTLYGRAVAARNFFRGAPVQRPSGVLMSAPRAGEGAERTGAGRLLVTWVCCTDR